VPAGTVEDEDRVHALRQGGGELGQEQAHGRGGRLRQDQRHVRAGGGLDGGEQVGPLEALVAAPRRALSAPAGAGP
jgi:hypothetical protein